MSIINCQSKSCLKSYERDYLSPEGQPRRLIRCPHCSSIQPFSDNKLDPAVFRCALSVARKTRPNLPNDEIVNAATDAVIAAMAAHTEGGGASLSTLAAEFARQNVIGKRSMTEMRWSHSIELSDRESEPGVQQQSYDLHDTKSPDPSSTAVGNEERAILLDKFKTLPDINFKVMYLRYFSGDLSIDEVAKQLKMSKSKVIKIEYQSLAILREQLGELED